MRTRITLIICLCLFAVGRASAQWAVIDPSNIAQSIVNTSKNVVHTSTTAQNMIKKFSRDREDLRTGQEVLRRCARIGDIINVALASY